MFEPLLSPLFSSLLSPLIAQPIPITQMDFISNLTLQRGIGPPTYTRPTIGTFDDVSTELNTTAAIDEARFETNGVLIEGESTNKESRSEELDDSVWIKTNLSINSNAAIAPDGNTTADKIVEDSTANVRSVGKNTSLISGAKYTISVFLEEDDQQWMQLVFGSANFGVDVWANFDLSGSGAIGNQGTTDVFPLIERLADGRFRCSLTATATSGGSGFALSMTMTDNIDSATRLPSYLGDGSSGFFSWGSTTEQLGFASSYIKTLASPVTRGEDTLSYDAANIPAPTENYTVSMEVDVLGLDSTKTQTVYNVDGETSRKIEINTTTGLVEATHGAVTSISTTALVPGVKTKIAFTVGDTNQTLYINGVQEDQDVKGTVTGTATALAICNAAGLNQLFGHSKFNKIFDKELTADEVANL